jgi:hypothetical protein
MSSLRQVRGAESDLAGPLVGVPLSLDPVYYPVVRPGRLRRSGKKRRHARLSYPVWLELAIPSSSPPQLQYVSQAELIKPRRGPTTEGRGDALSNYTMVESQLGYSLVTVW